MRAGRGTSGRLWSFGGTAWARLTLKGVVVSKGVGAVATRGGPSGAVCVRVCVSCRYWVFSVRGLSVFGIGIASATGRGSVQRHTVARQPRGPGEERGYRMKRRVGDRAAMSCGRGCRGSGPRWQAERVYRERLLALARVGIQGFKEEEWSDVEEEWRNGAVQCRRLSRAVCCRCRCQCQCRGWWFCLLILRVYFVYSLSFLSFFVFCFFLSFLLRCSGRCICNGRG